MSQELIVRAETSVVEASDKQDILEFYGVPRAIDTFVGKERNSFLNSVECGAVLADEIKKMSGDSRFIVEIPGQLRKAMEKGKASFIDSVKRPGSYSPNIKVDGKNGIGGQITIKEVNPQELSTTLSNLAMLAMVQSILEKMDLLESKLDQLQQGQQNDRIGLVIGPFKAFADLYPTIQSKEELKLHANAAYLQMQTGLAQLHLQIDSEWKELEKAPKNVWQTMVESLRHFGRDSIGLYRKKYHQYIYDFQLYGRLLLLSDVVLFLKGDTEAIARNHNVIEKYTNQYLDSDFKKAMRFLTNNKAQGIESAQKIIGMIPRIQDNQGDEVLRIEYKHNELFNL